MRTCLFKAGGLHSPFYNFQSFGLTEADSETLYSYASFFFFFPVMFMIRALSDIRQAYYQTLLLPTHMCCETVAAAQPSCGQDVSPASY